MTIFSSLLIIFYVTSEPSSGEKKDKETTAKNVILLIGDGMGSTQISAAAYLHGTHHAAKELTMDQFHEVEYVRTTSHNNTVTDSAAAATALSSTHKTDNGVVGKAPKNKQHQNNEVHFNVNTVLDDAKKRNMATDLVSTARITHATPAAFASHVDDRDKENHIAGQMLFHSKIDVLLGGGKRQFLPEHLSGDREDGQNLLEIAEEKGYPLVESKNELQTANATKLLGLFHNSHMSYDLDRDKTEEPSVAEMTSKALDRYFAKK